MKRLSGWIAGLLIMALIAGCANADNYVKDHYPFVDMQGSGNNAAKVYEANGKTVPEVAAEIAKEEHPKEESKQSSDKMFLVYDDKFINIQKDPKNEANTLIEIDTISYARDHYNSSFLQGYLTASLLQSLFGGGWFSGHSVGTNYGGWTSTARSNEVPRPAPDTGKSGPSTSGRSGSFTTKSGSASSGGSSYGSSSSIRKNDGSTPKFKMPSTSRRSGSFSSRRR